MFIGKEKIIPIIAMIVLLIGIFSAIYVNATQINKDTITINEKEFTIEQLSRFTLSKTILTDEGEKNGIALDDLIYKIGIECGECNEYTFKAKDGYQQTVNWDLMQKGVLTDYSRVYFSDTAHVLWVRDVIEIEVR
jgi:hypothetical protein